MSSELIGLVIGAIGLIIMISAAVGIPALAIVTTRYFKLKERELALQMEYRQKAEQQELALDQRLRRVEAALSLDHEPSRPELFEGPAAPEVQHEESLGPFRTKVR